MSAGPYNYSYIFKYIIIGQFNMTEERGLVLRINVLASPTLIVFRVVVEFICCPVHRYMYISSLAFD